jgi:hypothetical protein
MKRLQLPIFLLLLFPLVSPTAAGQTLTDDEAGALGAVRSFFDAFAVADSVGMQAVTDPSSRLVLTGSAADGTPTMRVFPMDEFIRLISSPREVQPVERIWNPQVAVHDNLATVWVDYNVWVGDTVDHCGRDAFQLFRSSDGWKIIATADTQRRDGCAPHPDEK